VYKAGFSNKQQKEMMAQPSPCQMEPEKMK